MNSSRDRGDSLPRYTNAEAWFQALFCYVILCGIACSIANALIIFAICKRSQLRTRFFVIICYLSLCRLLLSLNLGGVGLQRILKQVGYLSYDQTRFTCKLCHFWYLNGLSLELLLILVLVVDRIIAISAGIRYRNMSLSQVSYVCVACYIVSIVGKTVPAFALEPRMFEVAPCVNVFDSLSEANAALFRYLDISLLALMVSSYIGLIIYLRCQIRKHATEFHSRASNTTLQRQVGLLPVLRNQIFLHTGLSLVSKLLLLLGGVVGSEDQRLLLWGGIALAMDLFMNTVALLAGNEDLRESVRQVIRGTDNFELINGISQKSRNGQTSAELASTLM